MPFSLLRDYYLLLNRLDHSARTTFDLLQSEWETIAKLTLLEPEALTPGRRKMISQKALQYFIIHYSDSQCC